MLMNLNNQVDYSTDRGLAIPEDRELFTVFSKIINEEVHNYNAPTVMISACGIS